VVEMLQDKHDAFYVGDLGDIIRKYKNWVTLLPRVEPFYGTFSIYIVGLNVAT